MLIALSLAYPSSSVAPLEVDGVSSRTISQLPHDSVLFYFIFNQWLSGRVEAEAGWVCGRKHQSGLDLDL